MKNFLGGLFLGISFSCTTRPSTSALLAPKPPINNRQKELKEYEAPAYVQKLAKKFFETINAQSNGFFDRMLARKKHRDGHMTVYVGFYEENDFNGCDAAYIRKQGGIHIRQSFLLPENKNRLLHLLCHEVVHCWQDNLILSDWNFFWPWYQNEYEAEKRTVEVLYKLKMYDTLEYSLERAAGTMLGSRTATFYNGWVCKHPYYHGILDSFSSLMHQHPSDERLQHCFTRSMETTPAIIAKATIDLSPTLSSEEKKMIAAHAVAVMETIKNWEAHENCKKRKQTYEQLTLRRNYLSRAQFITEKILLLFGYELGKQWHYEREYLEAQKQIALFHDNELYGCITIATDQALVDYLNSYLAGMLPSAQSLGILDMVHKLTAENPLVCRLYTEIVQTIENAADNRKKKANETKETPDEEHTTIAALYTIVNGIKQWKPVDNWLERYTIQKTFAENSSKPIA